MSNYTWVEFDGCKAAVMSKFSSRQALALQARLKGRLSEGEEPDPNDVLDDNLGVIAVVVEAMVGPLSQVHPALKDDHWPDDMEARVRILDRLPADALAAMLDCFIQGIGLTKDEAQDLGNSSEE